MHESFILADNIHIYDVSPHNMQDNDYNFIGLKYSLGHFTYMANVCLRLKCFSGCKEKCLPQRQSNQ